MFHDILFLTIKWRFWKRNGYRRKKWNLYHEFKSWTRMLAFHSMVMPLAKASIHHKLTYTWIYQPLRATRMWHKVSFFKQNQTGLNPEFSFNIGCHSKLKELSWPYHLPIARKRIVGFIPFSRVLALCEMQITSSRIWTRVTVSISNDDNHYTKSTS